MASSLNLKGLTIEIGGDVSNLQTALKSVNGEITNLQANLRTVESALKLDPSNVDALATKQKLLTEAVAETANKLELLKEAQRQADEVIANGGEVDQQAYRNLQSEIVRTESSLTDYKGQLETTEQQLQSVGQETDSATTETEELGTALSKTGEDGSSAINSIADALVAAGIAQKLGEAAEAVYNLADSYSQASANIVEGTGATGDALKGLEESLYNVYYRVTDSEATIESVGNVLAEVNTRLGLTGESLENTTVLISEFAEHTGTDAVTAVDSVVDIMKKWGLTVDDMPTLLDGLTVANQSCSLSMEEIMSLLVDNKAQFDALGYSIPQATALIVALADSGVNVSSVMTGMRNAINTLSKTTNDVPGAFQKMITSIGECSSDTEALNMEVGNTGKTVKEVFGAKAAQEMVTAIRSGNFAIEDWMNVLQNCDGALQNTANGANTLKDKWATAARNISGAFSQSLSPIIEQVSGKLADLVTKFGQFLQAHPGLVKAITAIGAAFGALLGIASVITIVQKVISVFSALKTVISVVKSVGTAISGLFSILAANPIALIIAAVAALIAIFVTLYNKCEWFRNAVNAVWNGIKTAVAAVGNAIKTAWTAVGNALTSIWNGIKGAASSIWNGITSTITGICNAVKTTITNIWNGIKTAISSVWNAIKSVASSIWNGITSAITNAVNSVKSKVTSIWNGIKSTITSVWNGIKSTASSVWNGITSAIANTVNSAKSKITSIWNSIKSTISNVWNGIKSTATSVWNGITNAISNAVTSAKNKITSIWNNIKSTITGVWNNLKSAASTAWNGIGSTITNIVTSIKTKITSIWNSITSTLTGIWNNIKSKAVSAFQNIGSSIVNVLKQLPSKILGIGQNLVSGLWNGIADKGKWLLDKIKGFGSSILNGLKSILGIHSPSTETAKIGEMLARGLWKGLDDSESLVTDKADELSESVLQKMGRLNDLNVGFNGLTAMNGINGFGSSVNRTDDALNNLIERMDALTALVRANGSKPVYIDKRKLVGAIADDMDEAIGEIANRRAVGAV